MTFQSWCWKRPHYIAVDELSGGWRLHIITWFERFSGHLSQDAGFASFRQLIGSSWAECTRSAETPNIINICVCKSFVPGRDRNRLFVWLSKCASLKNRSWVGIEAVKAVRAFADPSNYITLGWLKIAFAVNGEVVVRKEEFQARFVACPGEYKFFPKFGTTWFSGTEWSSPDASIKESSPSWMATLFVKGSKNGIVDASKVMWLEQPVSKHQSLLFCGAVLEADEASSYDEYCSYLSELDLALRGRQSFGRRCGCWL